ncbi:MAG TPA: bifunctional phosphoglucose/phosphomannose isomerase [Acidimicrobiales bacterium]|nr:bifunctional phosphoglucose/phosphomannose isomerase [Acidimicrobiales bacterium]
MGVSADGRVDSLDMLGLTKAFPEQVETAAGVAAGIDGLPAHEDVDSVLIMGMGGSGIAGDLVAAVSAPFSSVPIVVAKGYAPPNFVSPGTLVFAVSFSGDTEETLEAAQAAQAAGAHVVAVSSGGQLAELAQEWGTPHVPLPADIPMPRAGLGAMAIPMVGLLEKVGHFPGASAWIDAAVAQLKIRREAVLAGDSTAEIAKVIDRTVPLVIGAGPLGAVAAQRWKAQVNENAKAPAFWATLPELCHNEIAGWGQHGDMTRQVFTLVELRHDEEHPQEVRRFDLVRELFAEVVHDVVEVRAVGEGALAQALDLTLLGDFVSLELAAQEGIDPGPIPVLVDLKKALAGP